MKINKILDRAKKKMTAKRKIIFILSIVFILMFVINSFTPLLGDDYTYSFGLKGKRIQNLWDVVERQYDHYFSWGGRSIAHTLAQTFLLMPKFVFNIANSLVFVLLVFLMYFHARAKNRDNMMILITIPLLLWLFVPVFGADCFWLIGSFNYLWTTVIILLFLLFYRKSSDKKDSIFRIILMFLLGVLLDGPMKILLLV